MNIDIKNMALAHIDCVTGIEQASFADPWSRALFCQELSTEHAQSFVAVVSAGGLEKVAGYICAWIVHDECTINKLATHRDYRRAGIGRMLLQHLMKQAFKKGVRLFTLEVRESNAAARLFYQSSGFCKARTRKGYYSESKEDALIMDLHVHKQPFPDHGDNAEAALKGKSIAS